MKKTILFLFLIFSFSKNINAQFINGIEVAPFDFFLLKPDKGNWLLFHSSTIMMNKKISKKLTLKSGVGYSGLEYTVRFQGTNAKDFANEISAPNVLFTEEDDLSLRKVSPLRSMTIDQSGLSW